MLSSMLTGIALCREIFMNLCEWKEKQSQKISPQYTHFDRRVSLDKCFGYITSPDKVAHHGFYPFIHYTIKSRKIKDGKKDEPKKRQIYYAAHIDGWIYRYYAYLINEAYNQRVKKDGIDSVAVAYRTNLRKSNIDFAKEAFQHIRSTTSCYVMIGDFTDFFDNLDHMYLKSQLCDLLLVEKLPADVYAIYKSVTSFSYVELQDLLILNGLEDTLEGRKEFNARSHERALSPEQFRQNRNIVYTSPHPKYGVPQGSPISAVLANVYMLTADKELQEYVSSFGGFYMRYSDDFIVIIPQSDIDFTSHYKVIKNILDSVPHLELKDSKTKVFHFDNMSVKNCTNDFINNGANGKDIIEFLGFAFDGKSIRIRDKTISKYYNRLYRKLRTIVKDQGVTPNNHRISGKNLYQKYSYKGSRHYLKRKAQKAGITLKQDEMHGNFLDYVSRSQKKFDGEPIHTATKRHMQKIRKRLNSIHK